MMYAGFLKSLRRLLVLGNQVPAPQPPVMRLCFWPVNGSLLAHGRWVNSTPLDPLASGCACP